MRVCTCCAQAVETSEKVLKAAEKKKLSPTEGGAKVGPLASCAAVATPLYIACASNSAECAKLLVEAGAKVLAGQPLIRFDLDYLVQNAPAVVTPIIVADATLYGVEPIASGVVAIGDPLCQFIRFHRGIICARARECPSRTWRGGADDG